MTRRFQPINPACGRMLHGGDYNPDQWIHTPEIWDEDMRLMGLAGCNAMAVGIFAWASLEPREGQYEFGWLDTIMDKLAANGAYAVLATPSGSKPSTRTRQAIIGSSGKSSMAGIWLGIHQRTYWLCRTVHS